jgi:UDP-N-acetylglucosamine 2-epimerase (non-hydrolysing)
MRILHIVGARPNFMKAAPVVRALHRFPEIEQILIHTGQHYDANMSDVFFRQLDLPEPNINLAVGSGSHAQQTSRIMARLEPIVVNERPELVLVYGDVNSTMAAALVCSKLMMRVGHVEAGLRSLDRSMPEEINRVVTDQLSDLLFTPSADADTNLRKEGIAAGKIHRVGNVMIDTLIRLLPQSRRRPNCDLPDRYLLVTLHRSGNVDDLPWLRCMLLVLSEISHDVEVVFSVHPRTRQRISELGLQTLANGRLRLLDPMPYLEFLALQRDALAVITDSGGIQEETTFLGIPCFTVRENTERPITLHRGTNTLVGRDTARLQVELLSIFEGARKRRTKIPLWDGHAAERIANVVAKALGSEECLHSPGRARNLLGLDLENSSTSGRLEVSRR